MEALADDALADDFRQGATLPDGYAPGFDERVVEWPWILANQQGGPALDAGSTLNHAHVLDHFLGVIGPITIATLHPEEEAFTRWGVSYVYSDLRDLPLRDDHFATVACISTLEHIGMDNAVYGDRQARAKDPDGEMLRAVNELIRVTRPGGAILITVPFGKREDHGWLRQFDEALVARVMRAPGASPVSMAVYAYTPHGWQLSDPRAAGKASYSDPNASSRRRRRNPAVAAGAVACIKLRAD